jgi:predicted Zn-dependent protease
VALFHVAVVPVGKIGPEELDPVLARAAKVLRTPLELRDALGLPHGTEDPQRGQHRAALLLERLLAEVPKLKPGRLVGAADPAAKPPYQPGGWIFVTDVDLYTAQSDGVIAAMLPAKKCAVASVRRLREAFYRRPADPDRQRARLVKELARLSARLAGLRECNEPSCVLAPSRHAGDLDSKDERFCRSCDQRLFEGRVKL